MNTTITKLLFIIGITFGTYHSSHAADTVFLQPVSVKYNMAQELGGRNLKKIVVDYNDVVYVLTELGLYRASGERVAKDMRYQAINHRLPIDITIQEGTGYLFYLYPDEYLSNEGVGMYQGSWKKDYFNQIAVDRGGRVLVVGSKNGAVFSEGKRMDITIPEDGFISIKAFDGRFYGLSRSGVFVLQGNEFKKIHSGNDLKTFAYHDGAVYLGTTKGYYAVDAHTGREILPLQTKIPIWEINDLSFVKGQLWAATPDGAFKKKRADGYRYYASKRWLDNNNTKSIASDKAGNVYVLSATGLNKIEYIPMTLSDKAAYFQKKIRERHLRYGLLSLVHLPIPGDYSSAILVDTDNDGLWSSFYLGSQALRFAVTGDTMARHYAWDLFAAYERLLSVNPLNGFPSRTYAKQGERVSGAQHWHPSVDSGWQWKGTTSSDEFVGHIYIAALMDQFVAKTQEEKKRVIDFIDPILMHIVDNNYNFVDIDGAPTLWGRWHPDYVNSYAKTISDRKLASVDLIAGMQLGYSLTGKEIYKSEAERLMYQHGYLENIMIDPFNIKATPGYEYRGIDMGMGPWNHSDDEMEFLSFWVLYHYAFDKKLKSQYSTAIKRFWEIERPEKNPLWNLITHGTEGSFDKEATLWYLREYPLDLVRWDIRNSQRKDLDFKEPNFRNQLTETVLSPAEQPAHRFNANEFVLDGGEGGHYELTGAEYLLSYWLGRYLGVIE